MKKIITLILGAFLFYSCLNNNDLQNFKYEFIPIDKAITPASFTFGEKDTITLKYTFVNGCYGFNNVYYQYQDTTRVVAINAFVNLSEDCTLALIEEEYKLVVHASQKEDYLFKFYKGKDSIGENIFEEIIIPVN